MAEEVVAAAEEEAEEKENEAGEEEAEAEEGEEAAVNEAGDAASSRTRTARGGGREVRAEYSRAWTCAGDPTGSHMVRTSSPSLMVVSPHAAAPAALTASAMVSQGR